jgi:hypothetical protein
MQQPDEMRPIPEDMPLTVRNVSGLLAENTFVCHANAEKLKGLPAWVRGQAMVGRWTSPGLLDKSQAHADALSKALGLTSPRCECRLV